MLDITFLRQNLDIVRMANQKRGVEIDLKKVVTIDDKRLAFDPNQKNTDAYTKMIHQWATALKSIPNIVDMSTPIDADVEIERNEQTQELLVQGIPSTDLFIPPITISRRKKLLAAIDSFTFEIGSEVLYLSKDMDVIAPAPQIRVALPQLDTLPHITTVYSGHTGNERVLILYEGDANLSASMEWLEKLRIGISEAFKKSGCGFVSTLHAAKNTSHEGAKQFTFTAPNQKMCATITFERDYISRECRRSSSLNGVRKYAHAITVMIDTSVVL